MNASDLAFIPLLIGIGGWIMSVALSLYLHLRHGQEWIRRPPWWVVLLFATWACIVGIAHFGEVGSGIGSKRVKYGILWLLSSVAMVVGALLVGKLNGFHLFPSLFDYEKDEDEHVRISRRPNTPSMFDRLDAEKPELPRL